MRGRRGGTGLVLLLLLTGCGKDREEVPGGPTPVRTATVTPPEASTATPSATATGTVPDPTTTPVPSATVEPSPPSVRILSPSGEDAVTDSRFRIEIETEGADEVTATLNGEPLFLQGGPANPAADIDPGPPLRDRNRLRVEASRNGVRTVVEREFDYLPPKARAYRIADEADLIRGPLAHGQVGDFLLANDVARFVIQDAPRRDLYSVGAFGGNIIDAELRARPGRDNFLEIQPAVNIETVINAQSVEVVNDGEDGTPAILRACGPDDVLDFVNPSTILNDRGLPFPDSANDKDYEVEGCTDYILDPGKPYVQMTTTIFNNEGRELGLFVGDYLNGSGELEQWTTSAAGMGELLTANYGVFSYFGFGEASGVDYSLVPLPIQGAEDPRSSFFTASGVSYSLQSNSVIRAILGGEPSFVVEAGGSRSFTRFFGVGDGSGGNAVTIENEVKGLEHGTLRGCVESVGRQLPEARVSVLRRAVLASYVTGPDGCFEGTLPPGRYEVSAAKRGYPYEGGGTAPATRTVELVAGETVEVAFELPATGRVRFLTEEKVGANRQPVPARVSILGFDPSPEPLIRASTLVGTTTTGTFYDITKDAVPFGFVWLDYTGADGTAEFDVEPGSYQAFVSRGTEYSVHDEPITVQAGETTEVRAVLARVLDTTGFVSSDFHVHTIHSADSRVSLTDRALQFAGEGVDNVILTDHHAHTDLLPRIRELGLERFVHSTIGEEITTWDYGHYNAYPLKIDPTRPSRGSTDWAVEAPAGRDFPAYGAYCMSPRELHDLATMGPTSEPDTVAQINHIDSFFAPLRIDTSVTPPKTNLPADRRLEFRLDPAGGELFHAFPALELWNGSGRSAQFEFLDQRMGVWMNLLNQGLPTTFIADTDTHDFRNLNTAGARSWTPSSSDAPEFLSPPEVARAVRSGRAVGGQGIYLQARLRAADGSGGVADFTLGGETLVTAATGEVDLEIHVQAPLWAEYDRIEIYANADTSPTRFEQGTPVLFDASPRVVLDLGTDFTRETVVIDPTLPGAQRFETRLTVPFRGLGEDTWFVVLATGRDGISRPMFPVFEDDLPANRNSTLADLLDGNLGELGTLALGVTNALYADVDGTPGFQAIRAPR